MWDFAHLLHVPPEQYDRLTVARVRSGIAWIDAYYRELQKGAS